MPEYVSREIVRKILGPDEDEITIVIESGTPPHFIIPKPIGIDKMLQVYYKARVMRACFNEDEGVTYP